MPWAKHSAAQCLHGDSLLLVQQGLTTCWHSGARQKQRPVLQGHSWMPTRVTSGQNRQEWIELQRGLEVADLAASRSKAFRLMVATESCQLIYRVMMRPYTLFGFQEDGSAGRFCINDGVCIARSWRLDDLLPLVCDGMLAKANR